MCDTQCEVTTGRTRYCSRCPRSVYRVDAVQQCVVVDFGGECTAVVLRPTARQLHFVVQGLPGWWQQRRRHQFAIQSATQACNRRLCTGIVLFRSPSRPLANVCSYLSPSPAVLGSGGRHGQPADAENSSSSLHTRFRASLRVCEGMCNSCCLRRWLCAWTSSVVFTAASERPLCIASQAGMVPASCAAVLVSCGCAP